jgi:hypothetical protein
MVGQQVVSAGWELEMSRIFRAVLCAFLCIGGGLSASARTFTENEKTNFLEAYVAAMLFEKTCKSWRLDLAKASVARSALGFGPDDFAPGGRYNVQFMDDIERLKAKVSGLNEDMICDMAEMMFGPNGQIIPDWMKKRQ